MQPRSRQTLIALAAASLPLLFAYCALGGCGGAAATPSTLSAAQIGELAFNEVGLSASGQQSCASCHGADAAHAAPNALAVQPGGTDMSATGLRASPSLRYLATNTAFQIDAQGKASGGFFWDGRANTLAEQAGGPLVNPVEMANKDKAEVVSRLQRVKWAGEFMRSFGADVFNNTDTAFAKLTDAIAAFQLHDIRFRAYTSKFDAHLRGQTTLSEQETRGLALFEDPEKGNCAACHTSKKNERGEHPLFTDFSYDNLGVPRNPVIPANKDPAYVDLGLCNRPEIKAKDEGLCGAFKVPTLRNVATRQVFFHNGRFTSLRDAVLFYVQRDTHPEKWYPKNADGSINKFDDLPAKYHGNVNVTEVPYNRKPGDAPALNDAEVDDVVAFLRTLTDGWQPN